MDRSIKKNISSDKTQIFAYLRKSTNKKEQELSLVQQEEGIYIIAEQLGIKLDDIRSYTETKSGFENKKRPMWTEMIKEIDRLRSPCILLCRDSSRLSRNMKHNLDLCDRIYGDNGNKIKIQKIYFLGKNLEIIEWDNKSNKKMVTDKLKQNYDESLETKEKSLNGILLKLSGREFPYSAPKGLESYKKDGRRILKQNEKMPLVRKSFEMKAQGKSHKEISNYLLEYGEIKIGERDLTDRLFNNEVYIGKYTEKTSGTLFTDLEFMEGRTPISIELWDKVQKSLGRIKSNYGEGQDGHIFEGKIRSESDHIFSRYLAKKTFPTYKGRYKDNSGKEEFIHISEKQILNLFMNTIGNMIQGFNERFFETHFTPITIASFEVLGSEKLGKSADNNKVFNANLNKKNIRNNESLKKGREMVIEAIDDEISKRQLEEAGLDYFRQNDIDIEKLAEEAIKDGKNKDMNVDHYVRKLLIDKGREIFDSEGKEYVFNEESGYYPISFIDDKIKGTKRSISSEIALKIISDVLNEQFKINTKEFNDKKDAQIKMLQKQKEGIELDKKNYRRDAIKMGYTRDEIEETSKEYDASIKSLESEIIKMSYDTDMDIYLKRLPEVLLKTVELASNTINRAKIEELRKDMKTLLEITTVELTVTNKKELKVKLFDVLDKLISSDNFNLEVPPGVEPGCKALQASA